MPEPTPITPYFARLRALEDRLQELELKDGGGGGTSKPMELIKDYVDARDDAVESRLSSKLDKLSTKGTIWGAVATGTGILIGVMAFGGDRFDAGVSVSSQRYEQLKVDARQDASMTEVSQKLDLILAGQRSAIQNASAPAPEAPQPK